MRKILTVARHEFTETTRTKSYRLAFVLVPVTVCTLILIAAHYAPDVQEVTPHRPQGSGLQRTTGPISPGDPQPSEGMRGPDIFSERVGVALLLLMLMFFAIVGPVSGTMFTGIIEEKSSRVIEVLLSAVSPFQLMAGKIVGLAGANLTMLVFWAVTIYTVAARQGFGSGVGLGVLACFFVYFVLGFVLISSLYAAIGSACTTFKDAQTLMMPLVMLIVLPMCMWMYFVMNPNGLWTTVLSFVPPITPMMMMLRIGADPDLSRFQIAASMLLLAVSVLLVVWGSAKVFRTGILMYGKPATFREILRWLHYK